MKVAIITSYPLQVTPYVTYYADLLKQLNIEYVIINKEVSLDDAKCPDQRAFIVRKNGTVSGNPIVRTLAWYKFVEKTMKREKCDIAIVVPTKTAMVLAPFLFLSLYRYIFDIRDYTGENSAWFRLVERLLINKSELTVISSNGFRSWLPQSNKLTNIHNMPYSYEEEYDCTDLKTKETINIGYVGCVDYEYQNRKIMESLGNDPRFILQYSGIVATRCKLEQISKDQGYNNVIFTGRFDNRNKKGIYEQVDIINAVYGNDSLIVSTALPNKLYDALIYKKPIIASKGTYLGELIEQYGVGFSIDVDKDNITEKISGFIADFDSECFVKNCTLLLQQCIEEQEKTIERIQKVISK